MIDAGGKVAAHGQQQRYVIRAGGHMLAHLDGDGPRITLGDNIIHPAYDPRPSVAKSISRAVAFARSGSESTTTDSPTISSL